MGHGRTKRARNALLALAVVGLLAGLIAADRRRVSGEVASQFGRYRGYTPATHDGSRRISHYLTLANGTRLAYDLYLPTRDGMPAETPLPVLFKYTPYGRTWTVFDKDGTNNLTRLTPLPWYLHPLLRLRARFARDGNLLDQLWRTKWLSAMVKSGYAVIVVERPGTGASFGAFDLTPRTSARETDELLNWIAAQKWSNGKIGMFGDSIQAQIQLQAASTANPHLKAILPATTWMDSYTALMFPGGVRNTAFIDFYVKANRAFDFLSTPVDEDTDGTLLAQARAERRGAGLAGLAESTPTDAFRDDLTAQGRNYWEEYMSLYPLLAQINRAGVPIYLIDGWYDICTRDDFLIYANLTTPKRLLVRPVDHSQIEAPGRDVDYGAEVHRWFDYWLKGIENGVMDEPPVHYFLQGAGASRAWQSTDDWPPKNAKSVRYYFGPGSDGGTASVNDGTLGPSLLAASQGFDAYTVDYRTTSGSRPRWSAPASPHRYPNMRANDVRALTYTTPALAAALDVVGHPVVHLWVSAGAPDVDAFIYLEEVDGRGNARYVTEGNLRASHRALGQAPYRNLGLPFHSFFRRDQTPIPAGEAVELVFDLLPTAWRYSPGKRLRVTVAFSDAGNFATPILTPPPTIKVLRDAQHLSYIEIPIAQLP